MSKATSNSAPVAMQKPFSQTHHGVTLEDPYHWLRDPNYPKVEDKEILAHLEAENAYYRAFMDPHKALCDAIYEEIVGRIKQDDSSVPYKYGPYLYSWKFEEGAQYRIWLRTDLSGKNPTILVDEGDRANKHEFFRLGGMAVSPDHRLLAWSEDTDGSERFTIRVKQLTDGNNDEVTFEDEIPGTSGAMVWLEDNQRFLYILLSPEHRPYKVMMHRLGTPNSEDMTIYEEADPSFFVNIDKTSSRRFVVIQSGDHVTNEVRILKTDEHDPAPILVSPRETGHEYYLDDSPNTFLIRTNDVHKNFRIAKAPLTDPRKENWQEVIAPSNDHYLTGLKTFQKFFVLTERENGQEQIRLCDYDGGQHTIDFPEASFSTGLGANAEYDPQQVRVNYTSMTTPPSVFDYDPEKRHLELRKEEEIPSGYDKANYCTERLIATSFDGAKVPISIVYRKGFERDGSKPLHLYAYGAYGLSMSPSFSAPRLSLLDRGFAYAIAHIRGGSEMGYHWYEDGKLDKRTNTFRDFIACAEHLIEAGFAKPGGISISGGSAGGTLMGAVANIRPDLFRAIVAHVPFVDVLNTMLDETLPLTPIEWPEWGNPITDDKTFEFIRSYSPYDQVEKKDYPMMMVTAGLNDPRVTYWEPAKWVAKLREYKTDDNVLIYKTNMGAGHGGKSGRFEKYVEVAEEYCFVTQAFALS